MYVLVAVRTYSCNRIFFLRHLEQRTPTFRGSCLELIGSQHHVACHAWFADTTKQNFTQGLKPPVPLAVQLEPVRRRIIEHEIVVLVQSVLSVDCFHLIAEIHQYLVRARFKAYRGLRQAVEQEMRLGPAESSDVARQLHRVDPRGDLGTALDQVSNVNK